MVINNATACAAKVSYFWILSRMREKDVGGTVVCLRMLS